MKLLVVSDNHGDRQILLDIVKKFEDKVDFMLHCGDSELEAGDEIWQYFTAVKGNCDFGPGFAERQVLKVGGETIYMTHGHLSNVRFGLTQLALEAEEAKATIALFGHTHIAGCEEERGILFLNPGSISQPRGALKIPTFAIIEATAAAYQIEYYNRALQPVEELSAYFAKVH